MSTVWIVQSTGGEDNKPPASDVTTKLPSVQGSSNAPNSGGS